MSGWESNEVDHTFSTGRTMLIRRSLPLQWLILRAVDAEDPELAHGLSEWFEKGELGEEIAGDKRGQLQMAARVEQAVVEAMFIRPRVHWNPEDMPAAQYASAGEGEVPFHISAADLRDAEISEALELAFKGVAEATRFREDFAGEDGGGGGEGVGSKPKPRPRARAGKR